MTSMAFSKYFAKAHENPDLLDGERPISFAQPTM